VPVALLDVIWIDDAFIHPPGPKMQVCVCPASGFFFRINSAPKWQIPVLIRQADNPFLKHDSYIECGSPLELDDYVIETSLAGNDGKIFGKLNPAAIPDICAAIARSRLIRPRDRALIAANLGCDAP